MKTQLLFLTALLLSASSLAQTTWHEVPSGTEKKLNTIDFPSPSTGYIGGNDSLLMKTTDGGLTWNALSYSGVNFPLSGHILKLDFVSETTGYMTVGPYPGAYKTTDGGLTWTSVLSGLNICTNQGLYMMNENTGFIGGSGCFEGEKIARLDNGAWTEMNLNAPTSNPGNNIADIDFLNGNFGLAASLSGYVYRTVDGGSSWDSIPVIVDQLHPLTSVLIVNDTLAYIGYLGGGEGYGMYATYDGGLTWNWEMNTATFFYPDFLSLHEDGNKRIYAGAYSSSIGLIFENSGDLVNWDYQMVEQAINGFASYNDSVVFAVGDSGYVLVNTPLSGLGFEESRPESPVVHIHPNPFSESFTVDLPGGWQAGEVRMRLVDLNGISVRELDVQAVYQLAELAAGMYVLELENNGHLVRKKIVKK